MAQIELMGCRWGGVRSKLFDRMIVLIMGAVIVLSPLVVSETTEATLHFQWRMFAKVNALVTYEIEVDGEWRRTTLDGLPWLDRGRHVGSSTLRALCEVRPEAAGARRLYWDDVDVEVRC